MAQLEWKESYSVGNAEIDEQHKQWIDIHNRIDMAMFESNLQLQMKIIEESLQTMLDYTSSHFRVEEEFMRKVGYPAIAEHVRMHKDFDTLIYIYYRSVAANEPILNTRLLKIVRDWVLNHILVEDRKYCLFANKKIPDRPAKTRIQPSA